MDKENISYLAGLFDGEGHIKNIFVGGLRNQKHTTVG